MSRLSFQYCQLHSLFLTALPLESTSHHQAPYKGLCLWASRSFSIQASERSFLSINVTIPRSQDEDQLPHHDYAGAAHTLPPNILPPPPHHLHPAPSTRAFLWGGSLQPGCVPPGEHDALLLASPPPHPSGHSFTPSLQKRLSCL